MNAELLQVFQGQQDILAVEQGMSPELIQFLQTYPFDLAQQEQASEHYQLQDTMNSVETMLAEAGRIMATSFAECNRSYNPQVVLGMPRSGWAVAHGIADIWGIDVVYSNQGHLADPAKPILSNEIIARLPKQHALIADDILWKAQQKAALLPFLNDAIYFVPVIDRYEARNLRTKVITCFAPTNGLTDYLQRIFD